jgi:hypothetical protein
VRFTVPLPAPARELRIGDLINERSVDGIEVLAAQELVQPSKLGNVFLGCRLVRSFLDPPHDCFVPRMPRPIAKIGDPPQLCSELIVCLLR